MRRVNQQSGGILLEVEASSMIKSLNTGDSLSVNGVCLTVVDFEQSIVKVEAVRETVSRTTLENWRPGEKLNLERSMALGDRMGGHIVQGHIDGAGSVKNIRNIGRETRFTIFAPEDITRYMVYKGSIAVDGVSLTIAELLKDGFSVAIIPHTMRNTNLQFRQVRDEVNLEVDILAKYVERLLGNNVRSKRLDEDYLKDMGY